MTGVLSVCLVVMLSYQQITTKSCWGDGEGEGGGGGGGGGGGAEAEPETELGAP